MFPSFCATISFVATLRSGFCSLLNFLPHRNIGFHIEFYVCISMCLCGSILKNIPFTFCSLLSKEQKVQVCDATGDAMKN
jgi:hypothetical protein